MCTRNGSWAAAQGSLSLPHPMAGHLERLWEGPRQRTPDAVGVQFQGPPNLPDQLVGAL